MISPANPRSIDPLSPAVGANSLVDLSRWRLVWSDEFDGPVIDPAKWSFEVNAWGGGNNELQYYTDRPENAFIEDGRLHLVARREEFTGPEGTRAYTSARIRTLGKGDWKYGRFEIRAKLPSGQGLWPAIWMLPTDSPHGGWAAGGEIDIMELVGHRPDEVLGTLHYGGAWPRNVHSGETWRLPAGEGTFADDFHVFAIEWGSREIRWFIDGRHVQTQRVWHTESAPYPAPFDHKFHLLLNVAVGGGLPGNPDESTVFPQEMVVDYVRVYQPV
ncbi:MAG: glycoside hydrolase family 16 protein [Verrucomicrobiota bacterium]